jgi:hypothetical protein
MLRKTLLTLSASVMLGTAVIAPNAALAQLPGPPPIGPGGPPLGGPPPGLGAGGPPFGGPPPAHAFGGPPRGLEGGPVHGGAGAPSRFPRLDGASGVHGVDHAVQGNPHGFEGRTAAFSHTTKNYVNNSYANDGYGHGGWRHGHWGRYGVQAYGGDSYAQDDGCYYVSAYRHHVYRRVLVCSSN